MNSTPKTSGDQLTRRLGTVDATVIGLGSMLGAGVFAAFAPAAAAAGTGLLLALGLAGVLAYCNAASSAQLAAVYPTSGGTYVYGRARLGRWWGFAAGWGFIIGKTASCAAMALTFATYAAPRHERLAAVAAVVVLTVANYAGITRTAALTRALVALVIMTLTTVLVLAASAAEPSRLSASTEWYPHGGLGVLQAAGLLFFAFAGYARIATLGEEVRDPARTIPRAILAALVLAVVIYAAVGAVLLLVLGPHQLATATAPLAEAVAGYGPLTVLVRIGAAAASLGALLALITGVSRTCLAMARQRDLPGFLAAVHPRYHVPHHAELVLAGVVIVLVLTADLRAAIGFSSFAVLVYYAITNAAACTQPAEHRRWPRAINIIGALGCLTVAATLPATSVLAGLALFVIGLLAHLITRQLRPHHRADTSPQHQHPMEGQL